MTEKKKKILDMIEKHRAIINGKGIGQREWESLENLVALAKWAADIDDERDEIRRLKMELEAARQNAKPQPLQQDTQQSSILSRLLQKILG